MVMQAKLMVIMMMLILAVAYKMGVMMMMQAMLMVIMMMFILTVA